LFAMGRAPSQEGAPLVIIWLAGGSLKIAHRGRPYWLFDWQRAHSKLPTGGAPLPRRARP
jgi:hypothetical protein